MLDLGTIDRLTREVRQAAKEMSARQVRYAVRTYYQVQDFRKQSEAQLKAAESSGEKAPVSAWLLEQMEVLERRVASILDAYSLNHPIGSKLRGVIGIGPVIAAGLLAHIDFTRAPTAGHIWRFAGIDPSVFWGSREEIRAQMLSVVPEKAVLSPAEIGALAKAIGRNETTLLRESKGWSWGEVLTALCRRPWNAELKTLCWKAGESFVYVSGRDDSFYGQHYARSKRELTEQNEAGCFREQALARVNRVGADTAARACYAQGKLPPAHVHARATRLTVKLFLSHLWEVGYRYTFRSEPPRPWIIEHGGHSHYIPLPPEWGKAGASTLV